MGFVPNASAYHPVILQRATGGLPASTQAPIFTIAGGRIWVLQLFGEVTTGLGIDAVNVMRALSNPTVGIDSNMCANSGAAALSALDAGSILGISGTVTAAMLVSADGGSVLAGETVPLIVRAGTIDLITTTTQTGSVQWTMVYVPFDGDVVVTPA